MAITWAPTSTARPRAAWCRIYRDTPRHQIRDLNVSTALRGDFGAAHLTGDQTRAYCRPTRRRTPCSRSPRRRASARSRTTRCAGAHFPDASGSDGARVEVDEYAWDRIRSTASRTTTRSAGPAASVRTTVVNVTVGDRAGVGRVRHRATWSCSSRPVRSSTASQGPVHDAAGDRRPDPRDVPGHGGGATTGDDVDWDEAVRRDPGGAARARSRRRTAFRLQQTLYGDGRGRSGAATRKSPRSGSRAEQAPLPGRPDPVRAGEPDEVFFAADRPYGLIEGTVTARRRERRRQRVARRTRILLSMSAIVIEGAYVATLDPARREFVGHVVVEGKRIVAVGPGPAPSYGDARVIDATGCLVTPGFVNTHQHLYQWVTRGLAADATLFEWLTTLYPVWARITDESVYVAAQAALAQLAKTGCTTASDHHYVFPRGAGDLLAAEITAAAAIGLRFHPSRGSMDRGQKDGGFRPDEVVEDRDKILAATEAAIDRWHDPSPDSMLQLVVDPVFAVQRERRTDARVGRAAPRRGVHMHTHLAETTDETDWCRETFNCTPLEYADQLGWTGNDVWFAHGIHFDDTEIKHLGSTGTGVAHCPSSNARLGAGIARTADLRAAGSPVGLGVDGAASNESGSIVEEVRHALLFARARGGPQSLTVRAALEMATLDGARILGRSDDLGSVEPGKLADLAVWNLDTLAHAGIPDPIAALVLSTPPPLSLLLVNGRPVVENDVLQTADPHALAAEVARTQAELFA